MVVSIRVAGNVLGRYGQAVCVVANGRSILHILAVASRASAPGPSSATSALFPIVITGASLAGGRRPHESKVDGDLLLEELFAIGALDGCLGLVEGGVLDEDVALRRSAS